MQPTINNKQKRQFRLVVYSNLAKNAKKMKIDWVVLHGSEGYPNSIGRDLDVICRSKDDADALIREFESLLLKNKARWVIHPNPIWGRRVLGISNNLDVAELHILNKVRCGNVDQPVEWMKIYYKNAVFPIDPIVSFFKGCLMPALVNQPKWQGKCKETGYPEHTPKYLCRISKKLVRNNPISIFEKFLFFSRFHLLHPIRSSKNIYQWLILKNKTYDSPTVPVYFINKKDVYRIITLVEKKISGIFLGITCVDDFTPRKVRKKQALQRFLYTTKSRFTTTTIHIGNHLTDVEILHYLIDTFASFGNTCNSK